MNQKYYANHANVNSIVENVAQIKIKNNVKSQCEYKNNKKSSCVQKRS